MATGRLTPAQTISLSTVMESPASLPSRIPAAMQSATHRLRYLSNRPILIAATGFAAGLLRLHITQVDGRSLVRSTGFFCIDRDAEDAICTTFE